MTTHAGLAALFGNLWLRFYHETAPLELFINLENYLASSGEFAYMEMYKNSALAHAESMVSVITTCMTILCLSFLTFFQHAPVDALDIWNASSHPGSEPRPLHKIACRILSICPNSASCECLFSVFGGILTKWRNRLSTENLTRLAELKLYVHEEHVRDDAVKHRLKHQYADVIKDKSESATMTVAAGSATLEAVQDDSDLTSEGFEWPAANNFSMTQSHGIREVAQSLIQAVDEEEQNSELETASVYRNSSTLTQYSRIPIRTLLDYSEPHAESWLGSFYKTAVRCLDDDLELYQLLDLDAEGDHSDVEDVLAE